MTSLVLVLGGVAIAFAVAYLLNQPRRAVPITTSQQVPAQLNRSHFSERTKPYLVVIFTANSCGTCAQVVKQACALANDEVVVQEVEYPTQKHLHQLYKITAVPLVLFANPNGEVLQSIAGPTNASQLVSTLEALVASHKASS